MTRISVGVLVTTFNRPEATDRCLASLVVASRLADADVHVYLADASSDRATEDVVQRYGDLVTLAKVHSSVHWARGMRIAWEMMRASGRVDHILWLNDDVVLAPASLRSALRTQATAGPAIVGGATLSSDGEVTYSGFTRGPRWARLDFRRVLPGGDPVRCDGLNGNFVLVPCELDEQLGGFPDTYEHAIADLAYTLTASRQGITVLLGPDPIGHCEVNSTDGSWLDRSLPVRTRFRLLRQPRGLPPRDWARFCLTFGGVRGPLYAVSPVLRILFRR